MIRLFLADDMAPVREVIRLSFLEPPGRYRVVGEAADGPGALAGIALLAPNVAILDVDMPGMTGIAVVQALRNRGNETPVILCTSAEGEMPSGLPRGVIAHLHKPFRLDELQQAVEAAALYQGAHAN